jgi:hypothetical protein
MFTLGVRALLACKPSATAQQIARRTTLRRSPLSFIAVAWLACSNACDDEPIVRDAASESAVPADAAASPPLVGALDAAIMASDGSTAPTTEASVACTRPTAEDSERLLRGQFAPPGDVVPVASGTLAYLVYDNSIRSRTQIRLMQQDGSDDRLLLQVSEDVDIWYRPSELTFRPDRRELAFTSGHLDSFYVRDVYAVSVDAKNLRRITNAPLPEALAAYPQGSVRFTSVPGESASAEYALYMQGMRRAATWIDPGRYQAWNVSVASADFGDRKQRAVVRNITYPGSSTTPWCAYNEPGALVDVKACEEVVVESRIPSLDWTLSSTPCLYVAMPMWTHDSSQLFFTWHRDLVDDEYQLGVTASEPTEPGNGGRLVSPTSPRIGIPSELIGHYTLEPRQNRHIIFSVYFLLAPQQLYRVSTSDPSDAVEISEAACGAQKGCHFWGLSYNRDGTGLYYVTPVPKCELADSNNRCWDLRFYSLQTGVVETLGTVLHPSVVDLAVSPDEQLLVLTVQGSSAAVRDLWAFERRTGKETLLRAGAAHAAFAP